MDLSEFDDHLGYAATYTTYTEREAELLSRYHRVLFVINALNKVKRDSRNAFYYHKNVIPSTPEGKEEQALGFLSWKQLSDLQDFEVDLMKRITEKKAHVASQTETLTKLQTKFGSLLISDEFGSLEALPGNDDLDLLQGPQDPLEDESFTSLLSDTPSDVVQSNAPYAENYIPTTPQEEVLFAHLKSASKQIDDLIASKYSSTHVAENRPAPTSAEVIILRRERSRIIEDIDSVQESCRAFLCTIRKLDVIEFKQEFHMGRLIKAMEGLEARLIKRREAEKAMEVAVVEDLPKEAVKEATEGDTAPGSSDVTPS
jgi:hypothetical protein